MQTQVLILSDLCFQLDRLQQTAGSLADRDFYRELDELRVKVTEQKLNLVVVGLFKRGKSSLVNALIGKELAPVAVTPLTSVITSFEYDPGRSYARICFQGGEIQEAPTETAAQYISEEDNPANTKRIETVRLFDPAPLLQKVTLIDTPGLGSAYIHNTESTREFIPKIDAAVFVLSADLPVSQADLEFLHELKAVVPRIIFVLNKMDLLSSGDLDRLLAHDKKVLLERKLLDPQDPILPVSAKDWLTAHRPESGIQNVLDILDRLITGEGKSLLGNIFAQRYRWLCLRLLAQLRLKHDALLMPMKALELQQSRLREVIILLDSQKQEFENSIRGETRLMQEHILRTLQQEADFLRSEFRQSTEMALARPSDTAVLQDHIAQWNQQLLDRFERRRHQLESSLKDKFIEILTQYSRRSQSFLNELIEHLSSVMGIDFDIIAGRFDLEVYAPFYLSADPGTFFSSQPSLFERLIPAVSRRKRLLKQLTAHFDTLVVQNSAAVIYDLQYRVQESFRQFSYELDRRLHDLVDNLDKLIADAISTKSQKQQDVTVETEDLRHRIEIIEQLIPSS
ncbi:MAG TPA: dynamin family protein [Puia sp.]|nr:dynamin family protein [Puia sp.]